VGALYFLLQGTHPVGVVQSQGVSSADSTLQHSVLPPLGTAYTATNWFVGATTNCANRFQELPIEHAYRQHN
jgi:hypothetical protein